MVSENDQEVPAEELASAPGGERPLCLQCLQPYSPDEYYCPKCGAGVGQYTAYLPFVDIRFIANFHGQLWQRVWFEPEVPLVSRVLGLLFILLLAPVMVLGLPFALLRRRKDRSSTPEREP